VEANVRLTVSVAKSGRVPSVSPLCAHLGRSAKALQFLKADMNAGNVPSAAMGGFHACDDAADDGYGCDRPASAGRDIVRREKGQRNDGSKITEYHGDCGDKRLAGTRRSSKNSWFFPRQHVAATAHGSNASVAERLRNPILSGNHSL
jgi:hypothetical protein